MGFVVYCDGARIVAVGLFRPVRGRYKAQPRALRGRNLLRGLRQCRGLDRECWVRDGWICVK
jgi:hypothetical protein